MRLSTVLPTAIAIAIPVLTATAGPALWPEPTSLVHGTTVLWLDDSVEFVYTRTRSRSRSRSRRDRDDKNVAVSDPVATSEATSESAVTTLAMPTPTAEPEDNEKDNELGRDKSKGKERDRYDTHIGRGRHGYGRVGARRIRVKPVYDDAVPVPEEDGDAENDIEEGEDEVTDADADVKRKRNVESLDVEVASADDDARRHRQTRGRKRPAGTRDKLFHFEFRHSVKEAVRDRFGRLARWSWGLYQRLPTWRARPQKPMVVSKSESESSGQTPMSALVPRDDSGIWRRVIGWVTGKDKDQDFDKDENVELPSIEETLRSAMARVKEQMLRTKFVPWKFHPRHTAFEPDVGERSESNVIRKIVIAEDGTSDDSLRDYIDGDESYHISISKAGSVEISTSSSVGTLRALQTLPQLFYAHSSGSVYTPFAPINISDSPKWRHRGLNLDIARNVLTPKDVKRTIDAMASVKLNRLHIHATDSQSWPLEIPSIPELAAKGSYCASCVWASKDLRSVQLYGLKRGVSVFLEIDMPGHTASIGHAFPELVVAFEHGRWERYALEPPSGQIRLNDTAVNDFLDRLMDDVLPRVAPFTKYFHTGGDEFNMNAYLLDPAVESNDPKVLKPLLHEVVTRVHEKIRRAGLIPIVWEELSLDWNLTLASETSDQTIVQAWRDNLAVKELLQRGHRVIFGPSEAWYLDCGVGGFVNPREDLNMTSTSDELFSATAIDTRGHEPFLDWCSPAKNWRQMYVYNPVKGIPKHLHAQIEGGEAHMWTEMVDGVSLDGMVWPRAAAVAEVLWGGPRMAGGSGIGSEKDKEKENGKGGEILTDATRRLAEWRERAVMDSGVRAAVVSMAWCLMGGGNCDV